MAMEKTDVFPEYACEMVSLGEFSGRLDQVMEELAGYYTQEEELYLTVRHGVTYPLFMLIMMLGVLLVLMIKVMPVFQNVFLSQGVQMNGPAGAVLRAGQFLDRYLWIFVLLAGLVLGGGLWLCKTKAGQAAGKRWLQNSRFTRAFSRKTAQYRLAYGMKHGSAQRSGSSALHGNDGEAGGRSRDEQGDRRLHRTDGIRGVFPGGSGSVGLV